MLFYIVIIGGFGGVVVRPLAFHLKGSEFDPQRGGGGIESSPHVKEYSQRSCKSRGFS